MTNNELCDALRDISMDVSCIRDMCMLVGQTSTPVYQRAAIATDKLDKLIDVVEEMKRSQNGN